MTALDSQLGDPPARVRPRWRLLVRMLLGCVVVIAATAATVATGTLLEVKTFTDALKQSPQLKLGNELAHADAGGAQTILLIGSDKRAKTAVDASTPAHSDTMLLVRLDPSEPETTMLSIPRDLKVTLHPDRGSATVQKINAAYTLGGVKLTIKTIRQVLGVQINHVVDVNFAGFKALVNYLGCIYVQVDRRYYHSNVGLAAGDTYDEINIQPGYQKLCGDDALHYVRYRHADTDIVRAARQQDFLRQIKEQVGSSGLVARLHPLERLLGKYATTDIRSSDDVLKLIELLVQSASHPVKQIQFQASLGPSYVTSSAAQIHSTVSAFLHGGAGTDQIKVNNGPGSTPGHKSSSRSNVPLSTASSNEIAQQHGLAATVPFKVYYPVRRVQTASAGLDTTRFYKLNGYPAYVVVVSEGGLGQNYDLQGTTWGSPPILRNPDQTIRQNGRTLQLHFEGQRLQLVSWRDGRGVYWLSNTLSNVLSNRQMLAIASSANRS
ncbi:MAG TPA: LCP family protein [Solirubrobacteraceae bacterium]|jgi:LCP family protein required for cell wall assembly